MKDAPQALGEFAPFWEHVNEMRLRIFYMVAAVMGVSIYVFMFGYKRFGTLAGFPVYLPWPMPFNSLAAALFRVVDWFLLPGYVEVIQLSPFDSLMVLLKISLFIGFAFATPVIVYNIGRFVGPGLLPHEKWIVTKMSVGATFLFFLGSVFAIVVFLPITYKFLFFYSEGLGMTSTITVDKFVGFTVMFVAAFGVVFETPIVMSGLSGLGLVKPSSWISKWRYVAVGVIIIAAAITPDGTGITQMMVAIPMLILYFVGWAMSVRAYKRHESKNGTPGGTPAGAKGGK